MSELLQQDGAVRREVLDPARSYIVQAPAGSGKTELLTQRILRLLAVVEEPEQVLAITFTRKAAGEMRQRLLGALRSASRDPAPEGPPHKVESWRLAQAVLEQDRRCQWSLLDSPGRLEIRTMDSFNARLVRQLPLLATLGGMPELRDDVDHHYRAAARATIEMVEESEYGEAVERLLAWMDNRATQVEEMIMTMLQQRDQWLPYLVGERLDRGRLEQTIAQLVATTLQRLQQRLEHLLSSDAQQQLVELTAFAATNLRQKHSSSAIVECEGLQRLPATDPEALPYWRGIAALFLTKRGEPRNALNSWNISTGIPPGEENKVRKEQLLLLSQQLQQGKVSTLLDQVQRLPSAHYGEEQWRLLEALFQVLQYAVGNLMLEFDQHGEVDHIEIALRALQALGSEERPTELGLRLDYQIRHILVDEFQDTSHGQFALLSRLTAGWEAESGRTLFLVGDPMQSIYRFRHAEVGLFTRAMERGVGPVMLHYRQLKANFRSEEGVVTWANENFSALFPSRADRFSGAVPYAEAVAIHAATPGVAVTIHPQLQRDDQLEAEQVVAVIRQYQGEGTVAILVRSRGHLRQITRQLQQTGIDYRAVEIESLGDRPQVRDLLSLLRALLSPSDRAAWLALLRAPWCGLSLQGMLALVAGRSARTIPSLLAAGEWPREIAVADRQRLAWLQPCIDSITRQRGEVSLVRWVQQAWRLLGGERYYRCSEDPDGASRQQEAFFQLLGEQQQGGELLQLARFQQRLQQQNLHSTASGGARVEVMTIHKSKGLQFDTVILPGLGKPPRVRERKLLEWIELPQQQEVEETMSLLLSPVRSAEQESGLDLLGELVHRIEKERGRNELCRLLYVAVTRAERRVHLFGAVLNSTTLPKRGTPQPCAGSLLEQLWPQLQAEYRPLWESIEEDPPPQQEPEQREPKRDFRQRLLHPWRLPEPPPAVIELPPAVAIDDVYAWSGAVAVHVGTVVHGLLQWIAETGLDPWLAPDTVIGLHPRAERQLRQLGVVEAHLEGATARVIKALEGVIGDRQGRFLLAPHQQARSEWALTAQLGGQRVHVIIDRTFVDEEGVRWIVDWKSSSHTGGDLETFLDREVERYREQLERYGAVLRLLEDRPQRRVLYFLMHQIMREV